MINGKIGEITVKEAQVIADTQHPPIIVSRILKANQGVLEAGSIIAVDNTGNLVFYDPSKTSHQPVGILANIVDTDRQQIANLIVHGTVVKEALKVKTGNIDQTVIEKLEAKTIFVI